MLAPPQVQQEKREIDMRLAIIGYGNIAKTLVEQLQKTSYLPLESLCVLTIPERRDEVLLSLQTDYIGLAKVIRVVTNSYDLIADEPDFIVECAGHDAVEQYVPSILMAGKNVLVVSVGALATRSIEQRLKTAALKGGAKLTLVSGAIGGIDLLSALNSVEDLQVTYKGIKPPMAWAGTPAQDAIDLGNITSATMFFKGTAKEAAIQYPKNANVAATLAIAGVGFEKTQVMLIADPNVISNRHEYQVRSLISNYSICLENMPLKGNAKTSILTVYSILREIKNYISPINI